MVHKKKPAKEADQDHTEKKEENEERGTLWKQGQLYTWERGMAPVSNTRKEGGSGDTIAKSCGARKTGTNPVPVSCWLYGFEQAL